MRADGSEFPTDVTLWSTTSGQSERYNAFIRDVTERKQRQDELHALAFTDALTGLANRALFCDRLDARTRRAWRPPPAPSPSCSWTSTTSRPSMTASVMPPVMSCYDRCGPAPGMRAPRGHGRPVRR